MEDGIVGPVDRWIGGLVGTGWLGVPFSDTFLPPVFMSSQKVGWGRVFFGELDFFWGGIELVVKKNWNTKLNTGPLFGGMQRSVRKESLWVILED